MHKQPKDDGMQCARLVSSKPTNLRFKDAVGESCRGCASGPVDAETGQAALPMARGVLVEGAGKKGEEHKGGGRLAKFGRGERGGRMRQGQAGRKREHVEQERSKRTDPNSA